MAALVAWPSRPEITFAVGTRADGNVRIDSSSCRASLSHVHPGEWSMLTEEHGVEVRQVRSPGDFWGWSGDALVTGAPNAPIGVWVGDCAPIGLVGDGRIAVVHAGWRGLRDGVVEAAATMLGVVTGALIGPHIRTCCYEFGVDDLGGLVDRFGSNVRGTTREGRPSLDVSSTVRVILERLGVARVIEVTACTGCRPDAFFSHRIRRESSRQLFGAWISG